MGVIQYTSGNVNVSNSTLTNNNIGGIGILNTDGEVSINNSDVDALGLAISGTEGNVSVTGNSVISGNTGGIYDTDGYVEIGAGVEQLTAGQVPQFMTRKVRYW